MFETRRRFLGFLGLAPVAALLVPRDAFAQTTGCYAPDALSLSEKSMRRAVGFVDPAPDPAKRCGTCAFFTDVQKDCGKCQILSGGPTTASAFCTSYAAKTE